MHTFEAMNTTVVTLGLSPLHQNKAEKWFAFAEQTFSRFRPNSELSWLNRMAGRSFLASPLMYELLSEADRCYHKTGGLFNPYMGKIIAQIGYRESFDRLPSPNAVRAQVTAPKLPKNPACFQPDNSSITLHQDAEVDLGGIAKGWSAHRLAEMLQREGVSRGAVNAGGDIAVWGKENEHLQVEVDDPFHPGQTRLTLRINGSAGVATSSVMKRRWTNQHGQEYNHIINPWSGTSSRSDLAQVTVTAPDLVQAEVYAKSVLMLGAKAGLDWLSDVQPGFGVAGITTEGRLVTNGVLQTISVLSDQNGGVDHECAS
ncbi:FAD:protein FMN transferase [Paenibacillus sp. JX-17]|uniref:FAD:protein FMN transferase n=1 Tax=Paenibacillus lacisoli TaxID=3064525 RepID=A0ABT9C9P7_9BACL|nr:FAD:protein FMN transferase [Paenibacillus sp. JX-17]MDO7905956.1 FAD:protein FMN transferase [Paenibacillus sp. JX-17]